MERVGFLVSRNYEELVSKAVSFREEFGLLRPIFESRGIQLEKVVWSEEINFSRFAAIIPKAVWDYFNRPQEFRSFLKRVEDENIKMINPSQVVRWNMDKSYFQDIQKQALPVLQFKLYKQHSPVDLSVEDPFPGYRQLLMKPSISGGAKNTVRFAAQDAAKYQTLANEILKECDLIIQPFYEEIAEGEYSFFFFGNEFSYAILKIPAQGDFRAHSFFKSKNINYRPSKVEIESAKKFVNSASQECSYARVDLLKIKNEFFLVELELIEPYLYFDLAGDEKTAAAHFVSAIEKALN